MKTNQLTGAALDWAVAKADERNGECWMNDSLYGRYSPSTKWPQGGPIIEREKICLGWNDDGRAWARLSNQTSKDGWFCAQFGDTPLIAAMRCYVASKLGDTVDVPSELIEEK